MSAENERGSWHLRSLQTWMQEAITHPGGLEEGLSAAGARTEVRVDPERIEEVILPSRSLSARERLGIYASSYFLRLIEVLENDYPALKRALGDEDFDRLARRYLHACPSTSYTLNVLGAGLADFILADPSFGTEARFLSEVARLERAVEEVFDEAEGRLLVLDDLLALPPERHAQVRLKLIPATRLLAFTHPVEEWLRGLSEGGAADRPAPRPTWVLVYRPRFQVLRMEVGEAQHALLSAFREGATIEQAMEKCLALPGLEPEALQQSLGGWFRDWAGCGILSFADV